MTLRTLMSASLLAVLLSSGCADYAATNLGAQDGVVDEYMRLDVYPSELNAGLLPESHWVDGWWLDGDDLTIQMSTPVQIDGVITGSPREPADDVDDDHNQRVSARVSAWVDGAIQGATTVSDAFSGRFSLELPPADSYAVAVVPADGSGMPFQVLTDQDLSTDADDWDVQLTDGVRLQGVVLDADGKPVPDVTVRPTHSDTGVAGSAVTTGPDGAWSLRVAPGDYELTFTPPDGALAPSATMAISCDEGDDLSLEWVQGPIEPIAATGRVMDAASHRPAAGTLLRFTSASLPQHPDATMETSVTADDTGAWSATLLPGTWQVTMVPPADLSLTPQRERFTLSTGEDAIDHGISWLEPCVTVQAQIKDPTGQPAAGVTVVASEDTISGRTFTATTNEKGSVTLTLPAAELHLVLTPADLAFAVTHVDVEGADFPATLSLSLGRLLTGRVEHEGTPVGDALVEVRDGHSERLWASTLTSADGSFQLRLASDAEESAASENGDAAWDTGWAD